MLSLLSARFLLEVKRRRSGFHSRVIRFGFMWIQLIRIKGDLNSAPCLALVALTAEENVIFSPGQTTTLLNKI